MGCRHYFVVDRVGGLVGEGGSRSAWQAHEHDSCQLVSQQNVAIRVFWSRCHLLLTLGARDFHHCKQRVSPFYHVSQLLHEKNVFRYLENGILFFEGKQHVSPFYLDLGLDLVGLIGNFWVVEQLLPLVVEQLLNPILSSGHVSRKSLGEGTRWRKYFLVFNSSSFHPNNFRDTISWECFVKNDSVRSCLI